MDVAHQGPVATSARLISASEMRRYFSTNNETVAIIMIVTGTIFLLIGLFIGPFSQPFQSVSLIVIGLIVALFGVGSIVAPIFGSKPTDAEYDAWLNARASRLLKRAMRKLAIDSQKTQGYLQVHGFVLSGMSGPYRYRPDELRWKKGHDGRVRFSVNVYMYFFPADDYVVVFIDDVNAFNQRAHHEKIEEYLYRDIVGVIISDEQNFLMINQMQHLYRIQRFSLQFSNGDSLGVSVNALPLANRHSMPGFVIPDSGIDHTVTQLRRLLDEAKQSNM